jgi:hypothetical protein
VQVAGYPERMRRREGGQATIEWTALVLIVALVLSGLGFVAIRAGAFRLGDAIIDAIVCAAGDGCPNALEDAYGDELASTLRRYAPNIAYERRSAQLPIDFRRCREVACSNGSDRAAEIDESGAGLRVTAYTRVVDRRGKGGELYLQYWLYFPESFTAGIGRKLGHFSDRWPGYHPDDWEGYQVRVARDGAVSARATAHGGYSGSGWGAWTGWYRVAGGSHAGRLVAGPSAERRTSASSLRLVPLESLNGTDAYRFEISPPWQKDVYRDPESTVS